jgi:hypothetical protein
MNRLQEFAKRFTKLDPAFGYVAFAFLVACMIWAFPVLFLRDDVLGKIVMVSAIIAMTMYHRIAGIIAVLIVIAWYPVKEGLSMNDHPLMPTTPSSSAAIQFNTDDEFRDKYCMAGVAQSAANMPPDHQYMLSPALFDDTNGKLQLKLDVIKQMNIPSFNTANSCKEDPPNNFLTIANMCAPACNWTTNPTTAPTTAPTPTTNTEGFTPMLRPHIRTARHVVSNGMDNLKSTANRLKRQFF